MQNPKPKAGAAGGGRCSSYKKYEIRHRLPNPKIAALLVIDMQNYFSDMAKPIFSNLLATIRFCRAAAIPVIFTRHAHASASDNPILSEWWNGDIILDGTPDADLIPDLDRQAADEVIRKNTYSAFRNTRLEDCLKEKGVEEVIVTGVMTNICCETTAREAFVRGYRVFFSTDATATVDSELHEATLKTLAYGFAYLVDCQRLKELSEKWAMVFKRHTFMADMISTQRKESMNVVLKKYSKHGYDILHFIPQCDRFWLGSASLLSTFPLLYRLGFFRC